MNYLRGFVIYLLPDQQTDLIHHGLQNWHRGKKNSGLGMGHKGTRPLEAAPL